MIDYTFDEFVNANTAKLLGFAYALTGNPHDAWDLTQETLARIAQKWQTSIDEPRAYARTVMVHLNIDRIRRLKREFPSLSASRETVTEDLSIEGDSQWLSDALVTLSPRQRTALALRYVEDLDIAGIACKMNCSAGTAKSHLSRGTNRLRQYAASAGIVRSS